MNSGNLCQSVSAGTQGQRWKQAVMTRSEQGKKRKREKNKQENQIKKDGICTIRQINTRDVTKEHNKMIQITE
jgi:hypothetical protein